MSIQQGRYNYSILASAHMMAGLPESDRRRIKNIILFGSVAQMRAYEDSDVDIFIDTDAPETVKKRIRSSANKIIDEWKSTQEALEFKMKRIDNPVNISIGKLDEWEDIQRSVASTGIVLYGKYSGKIRVKELHVIFSWENLGKSKGSILNKFYGYKSGKKRYPGLIEKVHGKKLGRGTIMIPVKNKDAVMDVLEKHGIDYSMFEVWL